MSAGEWRMKLQRALDIIGESDPRRSDFMKLICDTRRGWEPTFKEKKMIEKALNEEGR